MGTRTKWSLFAVTVCTAVFLLSATVGTQKGAPANGEWPVYGGDGGFTKYSPLDQINAANVGKLQIAWRRVGVAEELRAKFPEMKYGGAFRPTPLMVGGRLYASNAVGLVEAFDPGTGKTIWVQEMDSGESIGGASTRSVAYWRDGDDERILAVRGEHLRAIDAKTGRIIRTFGTNGRVDLKPGLGPLATSFSWSSGPTVICNNNVIIGASMTDSPSNKEQPPGNVQAFDVRTGKSSWVFRVIPRAGEVGNETWENDSWAYSGQGNVWTMISADEELGIAYLPTGVTTNDMYGGHRPGDNLFGNTLIAVRCSTGQRLWHFQMVHHDLWDYDNNVAPILIDITVDGKPVKAVVQLTKQAMAYVFDRGTGKPVWPIEERPVPQSTTPGEKTARTQPFPTKPAPFDKHGISMDDLIDFTPELRAEAVKIASQYVLGPIYTPPSVRGSGPNDKKGTLQMPGSIGGAEWGGAAFDRETNIMYIPSITGSFAADLDPGDPQKTNLRYTRGGRALTVGPQGLPITKPPYGRITAIDMNTGNHLWWVPNGDGPREHPAIKHLNLPPLGQPSRDMPLVTRTLLFVSQGDPLMVRTPPMGVDFGNKVRAYDKKTGKVVWEMPMAAGSTGAMITYLFNGKQYIVLPVSSRTHTGEWIALALP
jgi:quinoprotein glucose dehydrogenase